MITKMMVEMVVMVMIISNDFLYDYRSLTFAQVLLLCNGSVLDAVLLWRINVQKVCSLLSSSSSSSSSSPPPGV